MRSTAPPGVARLFDDRRGRPDPEDPFVVGRLLEEGDSDDLRWLFAAAGEQPVTDWFLLRAGRQLSGRSRAFWSCVLGVPTPTPPATTLALWPLA